MICELVQLSQSQADDRYDREFFLQAGISHIDMYFDDGSNPSDEIVRHFIRLAEDVIERQGKRVAVHCKAGLGRTGVLIGGKLVDLCERADRAKPSLLYLQVPILCPRGHCVHAYR
jgi:protein-tyrosine phosphatase